MCVWGGGGGKVGEGERRGKFDIQMCVCVYVGWREKGKDVHGEEGSWRKRETKSQVSLVCLVFSCSGSLRSREWA